MAELAGNQALARTMRELSTLTCLIIILYDAPTASSCLADEHSLIVDAIAKRDIEGGQRLMLEHLNHIEGSLNLEPADSAVDLAKIFSEE
jgi:DNA-binding GntR family transcriptional regulator